MQLRATQVYLQAMSSSPILLVLSCLVIYDKCEGIGIGWMKVDNNGRATAAEHQVTRIFK